MRSDRRTAAYPHPCTCPRPLRRLPGASPRCRTLRPGIGGPRCPSRSSSSSRRCSPPRRARRVVAARLCRCVRARGVSILCARRRASAAGVRARTSRPPRVQIPPTFDAHVYDMFCVCFFFVFVFHLCTVSFFLPLKFPTSIP